MTSLSPLAAVLSAGAPAAPTEKIDVKISKVMDIIKIAVNPMGLAPVETPIAWLSEMVALVKERTVSLQLSDLCSALFLNDTPDEELVKLFEACPLKDKLALLVNITDGVNPEDLHYGELKILSHPRLLKDLISSLNEEDLKEDLKDLYKIFKDWERGTLQSIGLKLGSCYGIDKCVLSSALNIAGRQGHLDVAKFLLSEKRTVNAHNLGEALSFAAEEGHLEVVKFLLSDVRSKDPNILWQAIEVAALDGHLHVIEFLLSHAESHLVYPFGRAVWNAAKGGHLCILELLLTWKKPLFRFDPGLALISAAQAGHLDVVGFLLKEEWSASQRDVNKAIQNASECGHLEVAKFLFGMIPLPKALRLTKEVIAASIDALFAVYEPQLRFYLIHNFRELLQVHPHLIHKVFEAKKSMCGDNAKVNMHFLHLMIIYMSFTQDEAQLDAFLENFRFKKLLKTSHSFRPILHFLFMLNNNSCPKKAEIALALLSPARYGPSDKKISVASLIAYMTALVSLRSFGWIDEFLAQSYEEKLKCLLDRLIAGFHIVPDISFSPDLFEKLFTEMRNPNALFSYLNTVKEYVDLKPIFAAFLQNVMSGTFTEWRRGLTSAHIEKMNAEHKEVWDKWLSPGIEDVSLIATSSDFASVDALGYIRQKFSDDHHKLADGTIHECLDGFDVLLAKSKEELMGDLRQLERMRESGAPDSSKAITQRVLLKMILSKDPQGLKTLIAKVLERLREGGVCPLIDDLEKFKDALCSFAPRVLDSVVTHTQHFEDLFLAGTEVIGSCQSVVADPFTNRCLMGYVVDAKNSIIAVKSASGEIESRAILRLLFEEEIPVLFLDRVYSKYPSIPKEHLEAIKMHAKSVADKLGVLLYVYNERGTVSLRSLGTAAPFEYEDATGGGMQGCITKGVFKVSKASLYARS